MIIISKLVDLIVGILWFGASHIYSFKQKLRIQLVKLREGLANEGVETQQMIATYRNFLSGAASREELKIANSQLRDIMRTAGLGVLLVLPLSFLTLPILVKIGERLGIRVLPSSFQKPNKNLDEQ